MSNYTKPPTPPNREELGANRLDFRTKANAWNLWVYEFFSNEFKELVNYVRDARDNVQSYLSDIENAKTKAESASVKAISAKNEIEGYVIPNGTAYSLGQMEELVEAIIWADAANFKLIQE